MLIALAFAGALAACSGEGANAPGTVSEGEAQALDQAAEMLDEQRVPIDAIAPSTGADEAEQAEADDASASEAAEMSGDS